MCVMEVRPGQHSSTIQQACAHNIGTVAGDLKLFLELLTARHMPDDLREQVELFEAEVKDLYDKACALYGDFVSFEIEHGQQHLHDYPVGGEFVPPDQVARKIVRADEDRARKYETR